MNKTKFLVIGSLIASSLATVSVFAATPTNAIHHRIGGMRAYSGALAQANITRTVVNVSNGIQITQTTSNVATLAKLNALFTKQQGSASKSANPFITIARTQVSNGIQTTITSTDAATVTALQASGGDMKKIDAIKKPAMIKKSDAIKKPAMIKKPDAIKKPAMIKKPVVKTAAKKVVVRKTVKRTAKKVVKK